MAKNYFAKIGITMLAAVQLVAVGWYIHHDLAQAYVRYGPAAQLNAGDIKSSHILDGTIVGADISSGASTTMNKFLTGELYATSSVSLPSGSLTTAMILNGTILSADMADYNSLLLASSTIGNLTATSSVSLPTNSITDAMVADTITASNYLSLANWFATTSVTHLTTLSGLTTASSSNVRASNNLRADGTLTLKGVAYTPPSADGSNEQLLATNGSGSLSWATVAVNQNWVLIPSNNCQILGTATTTWNAGTFKIRKEVWMRRAGQVRLYWTVWTENAATTNHSQPYINGVATSTDQTSTGADTYAVKTKDIFVEQGDRLGVGFYREDGGGALDNKVGNFKVCWDTATTTDAVILQDQA